MVEGRFSQLSKDVIASLIKARYTSQTEYESLGAGIDVLAQKLTKQNVSLPQDRYARQAYAQSMTESVRGFNDALGSRIEQLKSVLDQGLNSRNRFRLDNLRPVPKFPNFSPPQHLVSHSARPEKPGTIGGLFPWVKRRYQQQLEQYQIAESRRLEQLDKLRNQHETEKQQILKEVREKTEELEALKAAYLNGDIDAIIFYNSFVLHASSYPQDFPQIFLVGYSPESRELVIDYELPTVAIVPRVAEFRYVKTKGEVATRDRKPVEIKSLYEDIVASVALRTMHEMFAADEGALVDVVAFNGYVRTIDKATGQDIQPYIISVRVTKQRFLEIDLGRADKRVCLRNLGAHVSPQPAEMLPVKPIVEFNMVDRRFVEQGDMLSALDARPNLMDLNPYEFENLVSNLFQKMGLESRLTRSSKDGGVDVVAFDQRPILGGKVVIQAKRYRHTVGVSAVRDLYGTMMNEGANKGILVTTSGYGPDAFDFIKDKPIELIDGGRLLYLLEHEADVVARIVFPIES